MEKIVSLENLRSYLLNLKSAKTIVLATGCFDILHSAHKAFLKAAKKQGDVLVVGLESDKRVQALKGKERPINSWQKRAKVLATFEVVDFVFPLPESFGKSQAHLKLLQLIKPRILAVSENTPYFKKKKELIEGVGGKLFVFPFDSQYSTTSLLTKDPLVF